MEKTVRANTLETMIEGQKPLLEHYISLEGWDEYPWDLNNRKNQVEFKKLISLMVEEFAEAFHEMVEVFKLVNNNDPSKAQAQLMLYNEEIGDAWHFFIELLIFAGIGVDELSEMIDKFLETYPQYESFNATKRPLKFLMDMGRYMNESDDTKCISSKSDRFIVATEAEALNNSLLCGGRRVSEQLLAQHAQLLWGITSAAYMVANELKNRTWRKTNLEINLLAFRENILVLCLAMGRYLDFIGMGEIALVNIFNYKKEILQKRIEGGY